MLSHLLILAQAAAPAADAAAPSGITKITQDFGISTPFILAQIINFTVVAFILWKFAFKPVLATLDERQKKIASGLQYAEEMKAKLEAAQKEAEASAKKAQAAEILAKAQQVIELEKKKMLAEARTEIARLVVATTQQVLATQLSEADRSRYNEAASRELSNA